MSDKMNVEKARATTEPGKKNVKATITEASSPTGVKNAGGSSPPSPEISRPVRETASPGRKRSARGGSISPLPGTTGPQGPQGYVAPAAELGESRLPSPSAEIRSLLPPASPSPQSAPPAAITELPPPPDVDITTFDRLQAYENLRATKVATRSMYTALNMKHTDAAEMKHEAWEQLVRTRNEKSRKKRVRVKRATVDAAPEVEKEVIPEEDRGTQWAESQTGNTARDRGEEPGKGGPTDEQTDEPIPGGSEVQEYDADVGRFEQWEGKVKEEEEEKWEWLSVSEAPSPPNSLFDEEICDAKEGWEGPRDAAKELWEEMRGVRTQECRYARMLQMLLKQYLELRGHVMHGGKKGQKPSQGESSRDHSVHSFKDIPRHLQQDVEKWHASIPQLLANHADLEEFPIPLSWRCEYYEVCSLDENVQSGGQFKACHHNIRDACARLSDKTLKKYRQWWHPDSFAKCRLPGPAQKKLCIRWAGEIALVVGQLCQERMGVDVVMED